MDKISLNDWVVGTLFKTKNGLAIQMVAVEQPTMSKAFRYVMKEVDMLSVSNAHHSKYTYPCAYDEEGSRLQLKLDSDNDDYMVVEVLYGKKRDIPRGMVDYSGLGAGSSLLTDSNIIVALVDKITPTRKGDEIILHVRPVGKIMSDNTVCAIQACSQQTYAVSRTGRVLPESDVEKKHFITRVLFDTMTLSKETTSAL